MQEHARSRTDVEVGGVLVGRAFLDSRGTWLLVSGALPALAAKSAAAHVTFTADAWTAIHAEIESRGLGEVIVGWYHTHPGFGVFLSDMDLFIHRSFFDIAWQIAIVIDPKADETGVFVWKDGSIVRRDTPVESSPPPVDRRDLLRWIGVGLVMFVTMFVVLRSMDGL